MSRILVIDNYDSFVYTLGGYLQQLGAETRVIRNDVVSVGELEQLVGEFDGVLISPGPGTPGDAGVSIPMVGIAVRTGVPLLGVCLGHQAIAEAFGATVTHAEELMHGKVSRVRHAGDPFFDGVAPEFSATRYHSLAVVRDSVPEELSITAETAEGVVMALRHREHPIYGVQYHPESVLTEGGYQQLGNWLAIVGSPNAARIASALSPLLSAAQPEQ
ncbi:gamma-glutamyl-gamma-aminobutyrate hydrolase family protein [Leucobacter weissii]|uniref:Gamma-glutamyl-gamma-aminobutyrate hydrolase family protein n=1 Tax=Leucobacter weissii TaxID=1983706 RepID=A0A939MM26_9MICO|nr:gamma-glutamyl-gamma-aminobutyrate hydrolase family protein [Leucobacter weissii]MBO1901292.1 gamma-glutamyl-gamma-aminobutyrate hydrolase family protein [Leucobacter weissii]